ncbi:flagellar protein FlgN [Metalysinibacillus jejuensis]|uniref:flagellar protein FlgN n=1 Tax=Metalysinibacillus jejuensis TaxID=914327 RepID=UPI000D3D411B|nr:flagellar protein FlgN [Metalysinibacillus jejuensis]
MDKIIQNLTNLVRMHKSLLDLATKKTDIIVESNMEELDALIKKEQAHVAAIEQLERQRQQLVTDYLAAKGSAPSLTPTVAELIEAADAPNKAKIQTIREELLTIIDALKAKNELNQKMVYQSLQMVNMTLELMRPRPAAQADTMNYSSKEVRRPANFSSTSYEV